MDKQMDDTQKHISLNSWYIFGCLHFNFVTNKHRKNLISHVTYDIPIRPLCNVDSDATAMLHVPPRVSNSLVEKSE